MKEEGEEEEEDEQLEPLSEVFLEGEEGGVEEEEEGAQVVHQAHSQVASWRPRPGHQCFL